MTAAVLALLAACAFAASVFLQHRAVGSVQVGGAVRGRVVRRDWLVGLAAAGAGTLLQALAVRCGSVVVVQPLLAAGLLPALGLAALAGRPPAVSEWLGAAVAATGLAVFLVAAAPLPGSPQARGPALALGAGAALAVVLTAVHAARRPGLRHRALLLGAAAGCGLGVSGALLKQVAADPFGRAHAWPLGALLVLGGLSLLLTQVALAAGDVVESVPALTVLEPVAAVLVAGPAFGETLRSSGVARAGQLLGLVLVTAGVVGLAAVQGRRSRAEDPLGAAG